MIDVLSSAPPNDSRGIFHRKLFGIVKGAVTGGIPGAIKAALTPTAGRNRRRPVEIVGFDGAGKPLTAEQAGVHFHNGLRHTSHLAGAPPQMTMAVVQSAGQSFQRCQFPAVEIPLGSGNCVNVFQPGTADPVADPVTQPGRNGTAVVGAFGIPARLPDVELREYRVCPPRMALGADDLCYPKAVLSRRNKFRKWRQPTRPKFTSSDMKAIRKAETLIDDAKALNKALGLRVPSKPKKS